MNRAISLEGANRIFSAIGVRVEQHPDLGHYMAHKGDQQLAAGKTLTETCRKLVIACSVPQQTAS